MARSPLQKIQQPLRPVLKHTAVGAGAAVVGQRRDVVADHSLLFGGIQAVLAKVVLQVRGSSSQSLATASKRRRSRRRLAASRVVRRGDFEDLGARHRLEHPDTCLGVGGERGGAARAPHPHNFEAPSPPVHPLHFKATKRTTRPLATPATSPTLRTPTAC